MTDSPPMLITIITVTIFDSANKSECFVAEIHTIKHKHVQNMIKAVNIKDNTKNEKTRKEVQRYVAFLFSGFTLPLY